MESLCRLKILLFNLWIQAGVVPGIHGSSGVANHLSKEDVLLLKDEQDPKCFTRTHEDFTCFFENSENKTYDLLYTLARSLGPSNYKCEMSTQRTEKRTFLHICSFPSTDVFLYTDIHLQVVEHNTNKTLHARTVTVDDHVLLEPPFNVSLHPNGQVGQLKVLWHTKVPKYLEWDMMHRIQYSSRTFVKKIKESKDDRTLKSLVTGEVIDVQVGIKCPSDRGHWSSWSRPVQAVVPQSTDDISMECYTSDLNSVSCEWNGTRYGAEDEYKFFYKTCLRDSWSCTEWTECLDDETLTNLCTFTGDVYRTVKVKLTSTSAATSRTFYSEEFTLNNSIKTSPPSRLTGAIMNNQLCLKWEAPLALRLPHLEYEVDCQIGGGVGLKLKRGPEAEACVKVPAGQHYSVRVRAKPRGASGHWSSWSQVLTGGMPSDTGLWFMLCIPVSLLMITIIVMSVFPAYLSKLKQYFWPPVPNLDKVLQGFLTEINRQTWDPPNTAKQCFEETTSSVVEVMSEDEVSALGKQSEESTELLSAEGSSSGTEQVDGSPGTEVFPNYVTLNEDCVVLCPQGNNYVYEQFREKGEPAAGEELLQTSSDDSSLGVDYLNYSYVPQAEPADRLSCKVAGQSGSGNLYTNSPCS
ncbi:thrombopoietin receptor [Salarias fasciatus]|uniref:Growth hormone/erythropoietin receptor ligand binding domain-containing protein n=1 Tax=Salarias fasciatus TaxID=181472 RepID=A0A672HC94_SALFA|nr:thrombopoietin receptor [Salarias fasciatus]